ncbi:MAG: DNA-binding transcriptional regulator [Planctomycetia bacterium]|nr:DNA-binding transcriptional regulator [Planctomycetia bacterium]
MVRYQVAILAEAANGYSRGIVKGISHYIWKNGPWDIYYEERALDSPVPHWLADWHGDGVIVRSQTQDVTAAAIATGAKVVDLSENRFPGLPTIYHDYAATAQLAAQHLQERFYPHFGFVGIEGRKFSVARRDAFCEALDKKVSVLELPQEEFAKNSFSSHLQLTNWLLQLPKPCGIMACYDLVGIYVIQAAVRAGFFVPEEIGVVGANNDEIQCQLSHVPLTSVVVNTFQSGFEAARLLHHLMQGGEPPESPLIVPVTEIVPRKSTDACMIGDPIVRDALILIRQKACEGVTVAEIAVAMGIHRRLLERRFRSVMNRSVHDEIVRFQMERARELLRDTSMTLERIARRTGFKSASYFVTVYRKIFHQTPRVSIQKPPKPRKVQRPSRKKV